MKRSWKLALTIVGFTLFFVLIRGGFYVGQTEGYNQGFSDGIDSMTLIMEKYRKAEADNYISRHTEMDIMFKIVKRLDTQFRYKIDSLEKLKIDKN